MNLNNWDETFPEPSTNQPLYKEARQTALLAAHLLPPIASFLLSFPSLSVHPPCTLVTVAAETTVRWLMWQSAHFQRQAEDLNPDTAVTTVVVGGGGGKFGFDRKLSSGGDSGNGMINRL